MAFKILLNEVTNQILKATRGIDFEEIIYHIANKKLLGDKQNPSYEKSHQRIYIVKINEYAYVVPYIINTQKEEIFLKTIYPSRKYTKQYIKKGDQ